MSDNQNLLETAASEFIRTHAHDAINWMVWNDQVVKQVKADNKPVFLYIGTLSSAWSIAMFNDNFKDNNIIDLLSQNFNCIIVDREEHPELDFYFSNAVQAMTGKSGRPLIAFLSPELKPFFGGTYFPIESFENLPSMHTVLQNISKIWQEKPGDLITSAEQIALKLAATIKPVASLPALSDEEEEEEFERNWPNFLYNETFNAIKKTQKEELIGFDNGPRFAHAGRLSFLLRYFHLTESTDALDLATNILDKIANSKITDHIGGGFFRYTIDQEWQHPNTEKSLAENAVLAKVFLEAFQITENKLYENTASNTLAFILSQLHSENDDISGFYSSISAVGMQSPATIYHWSAQELQNILSPADAKLAIAYFQIPPQGNSVLGMPENLEHFCEDFSTDLVTLEQQIVEIKKTIWQKRQEKNQPIVDHKIITSENALAISTLAKAAGIFNEENYAIAAETSTKFIWENLFVENQLYRSWFDGKIGEKAFLEDYALLSNALLDLYEVTYNCSYLTKAKIIFDQMQQIFFDQNNSLYNQCSNSHLALENFVPFFDNAVPSGLAAAINITWRMQKLTQDKDLMQRLNSTIEAIKPTLFKVPLATCFTISELYFLRAFALEIAISGDNESEEFQTLQNAINFNFIPAKILVKLEVANAANHKEIFPILRNHCDGSNEIFFCHNGHASDYGINSAEVVNYIVSPHSSIDDEEF